MSCLDARNVERNFHIGKLKLVEIVPLLPHLHAERKLTCLEVGANKGLWMEGFFDVFGDDVASYHAFEPVPLAFAQLQDRLSSILAPHGDVIRLNDCCAGDSNEPVQIHFRSRNTTLASVLLQETMVGNQKIQNDESVTVAQISIDDYLQQHSIELVDIMKIDVEGYEWNVLQGMRSSIANGRVSRIYFEFGEHQKQLGQTYKQFHDFFADNGYRLYKQRSARNFFGLVNATGADAELNEMESMRMVLATREPLKPGYNGPRVADESYVAPQLIRDDGNVAPSGAVRRLLRGVRNRLRG